MVSPLVFAGVAVLVIVAVAWRVRYGCPLKRLQARRMARAHGTIRVGVSPPAWRAFINSGWTDCAPVAADYSVYPPDDLPDLGMTMEMYVSSQSTPIADPTLAARVAADAARVTAWLAANGVVAFEVMTTVDDSGYAPTEHVDYAFYLAAPSCAPSPVALTDSGSSRDAYLLM